MNHPFDDPTTCTKCEEELIDKDGDSPVCDNENCEYYNRDFKAEHYERLIDSHMEDKYE
jgi:hypothetical protein